MIRHKIPRMRWIKYIVTRKEEGVPEGESMVVETIFLEEEEEAEEEK
jgi:hypothetical protein